MWKNVIVWTECGTLLSSDRFRKHISQGQFLSSLSMQAFIKGEPDLIRFSVTLQMGGSGKLSTSDYKKTCSILVV